MTKQIISSEEANFLSWMRSLSPESQEYLYEGAIDGNLSQALVSVTGEELHRLFEVPSAVSFKDDGFLVGEFDFFADLVASPGQNI